MASFSKKEIKKGLRKLNPKEKKGKRDHDIFIVEVHGKLLRTKLSLGSGDVGDNLISQIAKQILVSNSFFKEIIMCTKYREDYEKEVEKMVYKYK